MKWKKYTIETTTAAEEFMSAMLMDLGIEGIEIEDNIPLSKADQAEMFIDFLPELPPDEGISYVSFYVEEDGSSQSALLKQVKAGLEELRDTVEVGSGTITSDETEDLDWINNWKTYFTSFTIEDILIKPTWEELKEEDKDKFLIEIDPGISFGTGKHETTQLCIRQLLKYIRGNQDYTPAVAHPKVLDVGCGSGILSIVALKIGAGAVVGTDLDPDCMISTRENMEVNHLDAGLGSFYVGNLIDDAALQEKVGTEEYEIVVANILAPVIIAMAPVIPARLKKGGYFITSGIIDFKEQEVKEAIEAAGMEVVEINHQGEWVNITARKNGDL
jgi:ribosomal protein L11 methyltransferase